ncbi:MAG TPA: hypothetical protein VN922_13060 [Bacteroidia bacterium]|nr:hypothetical protein [Bacteroidia bacterium]
MATNKVMSLKEQMDEYDKVYNEWDKANHQKSEKYKKVMEIKIRMQLSNDHSGLTNDLNTAHSEYFDASRDCDTKKERLDMFLTRIFA